MWQDSKVDKTLPVSRASGNSQQRSAQPETGPGDPNPPPSEISSRLTKIPIVVTAATAVLLDNARIVSDWMYRYLPVKTWKTLAIDVYPSLTSASTQCIAKLTALTSWMRTLTQPWFQNNYQTEESAVSAEDAGSARLGTSARSRDLDVDAGEIDIDGNYVSVGDNREFSSGCIEIRLLTSDKSLCIWLKQSDQTVMELKKVIEKGMKQLMDRKGVCLSDNQELFLCGKRLDNGKTLQVEGVKAPHTIYLQNTEAKKDFVFPLNSKKYFWNDTFQFYKKMKLLEDYGVLNNHAIEIWFELAVQKNLTNVEILFSKLQWKLYQTKKDDRTQAVIEQVTFDVVVRNGDKILTSKCKKRDNALETITLESKHVTMTVDHQGQISYGGISGKVREKVEKKVQVVPSAEVVRKQSFDLTDECDLHRELWNRNNTGVRYKFEERGDNEPSPKVCLENFGKQTFTDGLIVRQCLSLDVTVQFQIKVRKKRLPPLWRKESLHSVVFSGTILEPTFPFHLALALAGVVVACPFVVPHHRSNTTFSLLDGDKMMSAGLGLLQSNPLFNWFN